MSPPSYANRTLEEIVDGNRFFDSIWHFWQGLSWLDYAKRKTSIAALLYTALEIRFGIEQLWFDIIVTAVGGKLERSEYSRCKGDSTKMYKILDRLFPDHAKLIRFTNISGLFNFQQPMAIEWDMPRLKRFHGESAKYLHFLGIPLESTDSSKWFVSALTFLETETNYIWHQLTTARIGQLNIASMPPEVKDIWEDFRNGKLDEDSVRTRLQLAQPILRQRNGSLTLFSQINVPHEIHFPL